jgi:23S rRNA (adenine2503-C2)-methyltransferase
MTTTTTKINLLGSSQTDLEKFLVARSEKPFRARQIMQWIYQRDIDDFDEMTDLSKSLRTQLKEEAEIASPKVQAKYESKDGCVKWLFSSGLGQAVETVFIPESDRGT